MVRVDEKRREYDNQKDKESHELSGVRQRKPR